MFAAYEHVNEVAKLSVRLALAAMAEANGTPWTDEESRDATKKYLGPLTGAHIDAVNVDWMRSFVREYSAELPRMRAET